MQHAGTATPLDEVSAVFLVRPDGAALLQHRDDKPGLPHANMWVPPGGHLDADETPLACAYREFAEETGYRCTALRYMASLDVRLEVPRKEARLHFFWEIYDGRQPTTCMEGQALEFIKREDGPSLYGPFYLLAYWDWAIAAMREKQPGCLAARR